MAPCCLLARHAEQRGVRALRRLRVEVGPSGTTVQEDVVPCSLEATDVNLSKALSFSLLFSMCVALAALLLPSCAAPVAPTLDVTPASLTLVSGQPIQLTVTRRFPGGPPEDVTSKVTYVSSNKLVALVSDHGVVTGGSEPGSVVIKAFDSISDATALASLTVVGSHITSIEVSPAPAIVLARGEVRAFTAMARLTDGTSRDVTREVLWDSTNQAAAVVGNTAIDKGIVRAVAGGDTSIIATDAATLVQGRSVVFVAKDNPTLVAVVVTPNPGLIGVGKTLQFGALGILSDGTTKDLTRAATWSSSRTDVATVDNTGVVTGVLAGDTTITASAPEPSTSIRGSAPAKVVP